MMLGFAWQKEKQKLLELPPRGQIEPPNLPQNMQKRGVGGHGGADGVVAAAEELAAAAAAAEELAAVIENANFFSLYNILLNSVIAFFIS